MDYKEKVMNWEVNIAILICIAASVYNIISNHAIRGNDLKHLQESLDSMKESCCVNMKKIESRIERIENLFLKKENNNG